MKSLHSTFTQPELLQTKEGNGWRPEKGADRVDALKGSRLRLPGLPSILQLHMKRFQYDWNTGVMSKINDACLFPEVSSDSITFVYFFLLGNVIFIMEFGHWIVDYYRYRN